MSNAGKGTEDLMARLLERAGQAAPAVTASKPAQDDAIAALLGGGPKRALDVPGAIYTNGIPSTPAQPAPPSVGAITHGLAMMLGAPAPQEKPVHEVRADLEARAMLEKTGAITAQELAAEVARIQATLPPLPLPAWADPKVTPVDPMTGRGTHPQDPINPPEAQRAPTPEERTAEDAAAKAAKAGPPKEGGTRFRRTQAEIDAGLTVEQAKARRADPDQSKAQVQANADLALQRAGGDVQAAATELVQAEAIGAISVEERDAAINALPGIPKAAPVLSALEQIAKIDSDVRKDGWKFKAEIGASPAINQEMLNASPSPTLYIDCMPLGRAVRPATDLISIAHKALKAERNLDDYRFLGFGEGAALLSFGVAHIAEESPEDLYLDTRTPEGAVVKDRLAAVFGARVVQGVR